MFLLIDFYRIYYSQPNVEESLLKIQSHQNGIFKNLKKWVVLNRLCYYLHLQSLRGVPQLRDDEAIHRLTTDRDCFAPLVARPSLRGKDYIIILNEHYLFALAKNEGNENDNETRRVKYVRFPHSRICGSLRLCSARAVWYRYA